LSIDLPLKQSGTTLLVPRQAIYPDESGEPRVYKITGEDAVQVPVQIGVQTKDKAEIVSGVQEGDTVIVSGGYGLPEKSKVHIKQ
jgi:multidrug efflux pump subunit AcrA (membrane-fusion protein)